jgi:leucyl/phenylalanyl-tRNA---protein transferase
MGIESTFPGEPSAETLARRDALFRETPIETLRRWALGTAWTLKPDRIGTLPALVRLWAEDLVAPQCDLPDPERTLNSAGLCGMVHDLSVSTLIEAYRRGLFTFAHFGPLKWLSLDERCVLQFEDFHFGKTARRLARLGRFEVTFDRDFDGVMKACAAPRAGKWHLTWITPRIMRAYAALHDAGHAHSFEVWNADGQLVGGGYGVAVGGVFFTESLFSRESDASKIGFAALNWHLARWGFTLNDGKWMNPVLGSMGFRLIPRAEFRRQLTHAAVAPGRLGRWGVETDMATIAAWQPKTTTREECRGKAADARPATLRRRASVSLVPVFDALDGSFAIGKALVAVL